MLTPAWAPVGWVVIALMGATTVQALLLRPNHIQAWVTDAEGDWRAAGEIARLESEGFRVLHDRWIPGSRAIIDHIVIGPTGVFVVESSSWSGTVRIKDGRVRLTGRQSGVIDQAKRDADAVAVALPGTQVTPLIPVQRADLPVRAIDVDGVRFVGPGGLARRLREGPAWMTRSDIGQLAALLEVRLPSTG